MINKNKLIYKPVSLFTTNSFGKLTKVKSLSHLFDIVKSFEYREYIYFNIMPIFEASDKNEKIHKFDEVIPDEVVNQRLSHLNSYEENFDQNFLGIDFVNTLDEVSKDKVLSILKIFPNDDPKKIYEMINLFEGN